MRESVRITGSLQPLSWFVIDECLLALQVPRVGWVSPSPARRSPSRSTAQRRDGHVQRARQCGQVAVVDESAVDLIGELVQRRDPGGALRQDLDLDLASDGDAYLDLDAALN